MKPLITIIFPWENKPSQLPEHQLRALINAESVKFNTPKHKRLEEIRSILVMDTAERSIALERFKNLVEKSRKDEDRRGLLEVKKKYLELLMETNTLLMKTEFSRQQNRSLALAELDKVRKQYVQRISLINEQLNLLETQKPKKREPKNSTAPNQNAKMRGKPGKTKFKNTRRTQHRQGRGG